MPLYEFEDPEGNLLELRRPVSKRNLPVLIDRSQPTSAPAACRSILSIRTSGPTADQAFNDRIRSGFYRHEQRDRLQESTVSTNLNSKPLEDRPNEVRH
jgi:hypothetical protein